MAANVQNILWSSGDTDKNPFFTDNDVQIKATFHWSGNQVNKIDFELVNRNPAPGNIRFNICSITRCPMDPNKPKSNAVIHLKKSTALPLRHEKSFTDADFGVVDLSPGNQSEFLFKVHNNECNDANINCNLNDITPKTKDGTIVIGI